MSRRPDYVGSTTPHRAQRLRKVTCRRHAHLEELLMEKRGRRRASSTPTCTIATALRATRKKIARRWRRRPRALKRTARAVRELTSIALRIRREQKSRAGQTFTSHICERSCSATRGRVRARLRMQSVGRGRARRAHLRRGKFLLPQDRSRTLRGGVRSDVWISVSRSVTCIVTRSKSKSNPVHVKTLRRLSENALPQRLSRGFFSHPYCNTVPPVVPCDMGDAMREHHDV